MIDSRSAWSFDGERNDCIATRREFERDVIGKPKGHSFRAKQVAHVTQRATTRPMPTSRSLSIARARFSRRDMEPDGQPS